MTIIPTRDNYEQALQGVFGQTIDFLGRDDPGDFGDVINAVRYYYLASDLRTVAITDQTPSTGEDSDPFQSPSLFWSAVGDLLVFRAIASVESFGAAAS